MYVHTRNYETGCIVYMKKLVISEADHTSLAFLADMSARGGDAKPLSSKKYMFFYVCFFTAPLTALADMSAKKVRFFFRLLHFAKNILSLYFLLRILYCVTTFLFFGYCVLKVETWIHDMHVSRVGNFFWFLLFQR